ncbi:30S ribosome-binding factor RbfA [Roseiflexus sp.]|uniref:30S ribosome-binding factor RbfA n=1 Tax=Roseiflexus sp. TaxID=2562120 RepID=UPI00398B2041
MSKRTEQLGHEIQRILGETLQYELKDPRVGFATVVGVDVTADLQIARVRISVMGTPEERRETMAALEHAKGFLRRRLAEELNYLRFVPELRLILDTSVDYSLHIDELLRRAQQQRAESPPHQLEDGKPSE